MDLKGLLSQPHAIVTFDNPAFPLQDVLRISADLFHVYLATYSPAVVEVEGTYGGVKERSFIVGLTRNDDHDAHLIFGSRESGEYELLGDEIGRLQILQLVSLAASIGQETILLSTGSFHQFYFLSGPEKGRLVVGNGTEFFDDAPAENYSKVEGVYFQHKLYGESQVGDGRFAAGPHSIYDLLSFMGNGSAFDSLKRAFREVSQVTELVAFERRCFVRFKGKAFPIGSRQFQVLASIRDNPGITRDELESRFTFNIGSPSDLKRWPFDFFKAFRTMNNIDITEILRKEGDWVTGKIYFQT